MSSQKVKPVIVLGCPRSGTTVMGHYVGSSATTLDLGEFAAFYLALRTAPYEFRNVPGPYRTEYLAELAEHASDFAARVAARAGCHHYCDSTPWNLLVASELAQLLPEATFVLMLRRYPGTIQSLRRSFDQGYRFAGATIEESAGVWTSFYDHVVDLPMERTIVVDYDKLCAEPAPELDRFDEIYARLVPGTDRLSRAVFAVSHAVPHGAERPCLAVLGGGSGQVRLVGRPAVDLDAWGPSEEEVVAPLVRETAARLAAVTHQPRSPAPPADSIEA